MVEGKYLKFLLIFILLNLFSFYSYAGAWLPQVGEFKIGFSYGVVDNKTKKEQENRDHIFIELRKEISSLYNKKYEIENEAYTEKRRLYNIERAKLEKIKNNIEILEQITADLSAFNDNFFNSIDLEYGLSTQESFGMKISYKQDQTSISPMPLYKKIKLDDKLIAVFYKYKLFQSKEFILSLQPNFHFSTHNNRSFSKYFDIGLMLGHSKQKKKYSLYSEIGVVARTPFYNNKGDVSYVLMFNEGTKLNNGFMVSNYTEYEHIVNKKSVYESTIYDQLAIAKEICFDVKKSKCFTTQVGYFWKESLVERTYKISGPIFSLWLNI